MKRVNSSDRERGLREILDAASRFQYTTTEDLLDMDTDMVSLFVDDAKIYRHVTTPGSATSFYNIARALERDKRYLEANSRYRCSAFAGFVHSGSHVGCLLILRSEIKDGLEWIEWSSSNGDNFGSILVRLRDLPSPTLTKLIRRNYRIHESRAAAILSAAVRFMPGLR